MYLFEISDTNVLFCLVGKHLKGTKINRHHEDSFSSTDLTYRLSPLESIKIEILSLQSNFCENHSKCLRTFSRRTSSWTLSRTGSWTGSGFVTTFATSFAITIFPSFSSVYSIAERFDIIRICESALIVIYITSCPFLRFKKWKIKHLLWRSSMIIKSSKTTSHRRWKNIK